MTSRPKTPLLVAAVLLLLLAWPTLRQLAHLYIDDGNYSHGFWIPVIALFMAYQRRNEPAYAARLFAWVGLGLLAMGTAAAVFGRWYDVAIQPTHNLYLFIGGVGIILCLLGLCWGFLKQGHTASVTLPLVYLVFALPIPEGLVAALTMPLQRLSAVLATILLRWTGVVVFREGNVLHLPTASVGIAEACSGIRSIWVLLAIAAALGFLLRLRPWRTLILLVSVPVWALAGNLLRVFIAAMFVARDRPDLAEGRVHEISGLLTIALAGVGLFMTAWALQKRNLSPPKPAARKEVLHGPGAVPVEDGPARRDGGALATIPLSVGIASVVVLAIGCGAAEFIERHYQKAYAECYRTEVELIQGRKSLAEFPTQIGEFSMREEGELRRQERDLLKPSDSLRRSYMGKIRAGISLTIIYWEPRLIRPNRKMLFTGPHNLDRCYPASGWEKAGDSSDADLRLDWLPGETVHSRYFVKGTDPQLLLFWRTEHSFAVASLKGRLKAMVESWNDPRTSFVESQYTVAIGVTGINSPTLARKIALNFARHIAPLLPEYGIGREEERSGSQAVKQSDGKAVGR